LLAEAEHARPISVRNEERGYRPALNALLVVDLAAQIVEPARDDMIASSAADPLSEPACATRRRVDGCEWMLDTEPIERGKETLRRFDALNRGGIVAPSTGQR